MEPEVEPHVENIAHLLPIGGRLHEAIEEALRRALREPGIRALGLECIEDTLLQFLGAFELGAGDHLARFLMDEHRDRHAPGALPRDHPIGALLDHAADAVAALRRTKRVSPMDLSASSRRLAFCLEPFTAVGLSIAMNHCGVLR